MKKFIIILLLLLPIFLMVTISIAGRIFSFLSYISVERVEIVDEDGESLETLTISKGDEITLNVKIYPELANNKALNYFSSDKNIVEVDTEGVVKAVGYGYAEVTVQSQDTDVKDKLAIKVAADQVESVDIYLEEKELSLYQTYTLTAIVYPKQLPAEKKNIIWSSSDPAYVEIDQNGKITAKKITAENQYITITVTTVDGGKTDTCRVKVVSEVLSFKPKITEGKDVYVTDQLTINLKDLIIYDSTKVSASDIKFKITGGKSYAQIEGDNLVFKSDSDFEGKYIIVLAYVDKGAIQSELPFDVRYLSNKS